MRFLDAGEKALIIELGDEISPQINAKIKKITSFLDEQKLKGVFDLLPTYRSIIVYFNPLEIKKETIVELVSKNCNLKDEDESQSQKDIVEIPVVYGGIYGEDIENIANTNNLSVEEVIEIHTSGEYLVYMLGFTAGFPYLGGMSKKIATPRLKEPRLKIPAGSVGIAGEQTGIYPLESPGGWQLLGKTPLELFNAKKENPCLLNVGEYIKFVQIDEDEYKRIELSVKDGTFEPKKYRV